MKNTMTIQVGDKRVTFVKNPRLLVTVAMDTKTGGNKFVFASKPVPKK